MSQDANIEAQSFAALLRRFRIEADLTQEMLADRAEVSVRGIQDLERGVSKPQRDTLRRLVDALSLSDDDQEALQGASAPSPRRRTASVEPATPRRVTLGTAFLPTPLTPLIGRNAAVAALLSRLRADPGQTPEARLLTLTGPGGIGKTRLAQHLAGELVNDFPDGVAYVSLAAIHDPALVAASIARALDLREDVGRLPADQVREFLQARRSLVVLDNFEQVLDASGLVLDLLGGCPDISLLVTSRAPLHVRGEFEFAVPPLELPPVDGRSGPEKGSATSYAAVALFGERARMANHDFQLNAATAPLIGEICRRLDGLPLAIELAAAKVKILPLHDLLTRLERRLGLLTGGARDLPARQQTMRDTIAWSYDRLEPDDQALFRRLAVFVGGAELESGGAVCALSTGLDGPPPLPHDPAGQTAVLEGVASLVDNSLLLPVHVPGNPARWLMLETIREYGLECLEASGESPLVHQRHAEYFLALAERAEPALTGPDQNAWLDHLDREHDNLRAAFSWATSPKFAPEKDERSIALRMAGALWRFWYIRGPVLEGREWLDVALKSSRLSANATIRAKAHYGAGVLAQLQGDYTQSVTHSEQSLALYREGGNDRGMAASLNNLGSVSRDRGEYGRATELYEQSLAIARRLGVAQDIAIIVLNLGVVARYQADYGRAASLYEESLDLLQSTGNLQAIATAMTNLAEVMGYQGNTARAGELFRRSLRLHQEIGNKEGVAAGIEGLAVTMWREGDPRRAATLSGAAATLRERIGIPILPHDRAEFERELAAIKAALGDQDFVAAWAEGVAMDIDDLDDHAAL